MPNAVIIDISKKRQSNRWCRRRSSPNKFNKIRPILLILKLFGVFPYRTNSKGVQSLGIWDYAWSGAYLINYSMCLIKELYDISIMPTWNNITHFAYRCYTLAFMLKSTIFYIAITLDTLYSITSRSTILFFEKLQKFDESVNRLGHPREEKTALYWMMTVIGMATTHGMYIRQYDNSGYATMSLQILHMPLCLKRTIEIGMINQRLRHLNDMIRRHVSFGRSSYDRLEVTMADIVSLNTDLIETIEIFNRQNSWNTLLSFGGLLVGSMSISTYLWCFNGERWAYNMLFFNGLLQLIVPCYMGSLTVHTATDTVGLFTDVRTTIKNRTTIEERIGVTMHLLHTRMKFTAGSVFNVELGTFVGITMCTFSFVVMISMKYNAYASSNSERL